MKPRILSLHSLLACSGLLPALALADPAPPTEPLDFFEKKIRPILTESCYKCHSLERGKAKGDLTLDTRGALLKGGKTGPAIVPGAPDKSLLITAIHYTDPDMQMPPNGGKTLTRANRGSHRMGSDGRAGPALGGPSGQRGETLRAHRQSADALGVSTAQQTRHSPEQKPAVVPHTGGRVHPPKT